MLTLKIRETGNLNGVIIRPTENTERLSNTEQKLVKDFLTSFPKMEGRNLIEKIGTDRAVVLQNEGKPHICVIDCGVKANIIRELLSLKCRVSVIPSTFSADDIISLHPDGLVFSNGPGDPAACQNLIKNASAVIGKKPILGICLGHQILSLALGATTYKMKFGHHGVNHPVRDERNLRVHITSQNHGFAVKENTLPKDTEVLFRNVNDNTIEGIIHKKLPLITAQFHPEAAPGPKDTEWIFKEFLQLIG